MAEQTSAVHGDAKEAVRTLPAAFWPIFMPSRYTTDASEGARKAVTEAGQRLVASEFAILDRHLEGREPILDGGRSIIDAYAFPMMRWATKLLPDGLNDYPNVQELHDRVAADAAVQRVLARELAAGHD